MRIEKTAADTIEKFGMLNKGEQVLAGFSGGADSVCMVSLLVGLGYKVSCAHVNHGMRDTARRDEDFCRKFCEERGLDFECIRIEPGSLKSENAARKARYDFFESVMRKKGILKLATAHNKNDSAETVFLHMLRGASTDGLGGISPTDGRLIRPLIFIKKKDILRYCEENGLTYMTDETNMEDIYARNRLRNSIFPELEKYFNPRLVDTVADNARYTAEDAEFLKKTAQTELKNASRGGGADIGKLKKLDRAILNRVIRLMWQRAAGSGQAPCGRHIDAVCALLERGETGSGYDLPEGICAKISYGILYIGKKSGTTEYREPLELDVWRKIPGTDSEIRIRRGGGGLEVSLCGGEALEMRSRINGDKFSPQGMTGTKKLSDFFIDAKIDRKRRAQIPVLLADGEILAIGDMRADRAFAPGKRDMLCSVEIRRCL